MPSDDELSTYERQVTAAIDLIALSLTTAYGELEALPGELVNEGTSDAERRAGQVERALALVQDARDATEGLRTTTGL